MTNCPKCGAANFPSADFCGRCFTLLSARGASDSSGHASTQPVAKGATAAPEDERTLGSANRTTKPGEGTHRLERESASTLLGRVLAGQMPLWLLFALLLVTIVIVPPLVFFLVLVGLISIEPTALPWLSLILGPTAVLATTGPVAAILTVGIFRAANRVGPAAVFVKIGAVGALFFAPAVSWPLAMEAFGRLSF